MKKMYCILLAVLMLLSLVACGGKEDSEKAAWAGQFAAGYGRADITPTGSVSMTGYAEAGESVRMSQGVLDKLYLTCIALTDEDGSTVLLYTLDCIRINHLPATEIRKAVSEATGVPVDNILICATHSHSTPDVDQALVSEAAVQAATDALADRAAAAVSYGAAETERMTFVRHYNTENGFVSGSNFGPSDKKVSHTTEADKELRLLQFTREGKKPIVMINWMGHATMVSTGSSNFGKAHRYMISADYVGFCRDFVEKNSDCHFALFMGASGNLSTSSALAGEERTDSPIEYGEILGQYVLDTVKIASPIQTGPVKVTNAQFSSARAEITLNSMGCGEIGLIAGPYEMFDTVSMNVREQSPYKATFVLTQTNGAFGYMATDICYDYDDCYECRHTNFAKGDAEKTVDLYLDMLNTVHG